MKVSSIEPDDRESKRIRRYAKSACAARKIGELLTDDEIEFFTGIPASTFKNYRLGISAMPIEVASAIYAGCPTTRKILYPLLCPEGFSLVQNDKTNPVLSSENAAEIMMELTANLGDIAGKLKTLQKRIIPRRSFLEQVMDDVLAARDKVEALADSTSKAINQALFRKGEK
jgi:hypothetical protein